MTDPASQEPVRMSPRVERRQLEYFLAVVDHGSYTRAAESMFLAQSALSHGIRKLERILGGPLFERIQGRTVLTELGRSTLGPARNALEGLARVEEAAAEVRGLSSASLTISTLSTLSYEPTAGLVGALRREHPGMRVRIIAPRLLLTSAVVESVRSGAAELGVVEAPTPDDLVSHPLPDQEMRVLLPPSAAGLVDETVTLEEVARYGLIVGPYWEGSPLAQRLTRAHPELTRAIRVRTAHRNSFVPLAMAGAGAAFVPVPQAERAVRRGGTVARLHPPIHRTLALVHRKGYLSPGAARVVELAARLVTDSS